MEKYKQMTSLYLASIGMTIELKFIEFNQFTEKKHYKNWTYFYAHTNTSILNICSV